MPGFIKSPRDEKGWAAAKSHFQDSSGHAPKSDKDWATVTTIYKNWCAKHGGCSKMKSEGSVRMAGIFQPPPAMFVALTDWAHKTYAGHVWAKCEQRLKELDVRPDEFYKNVVDSIGQALGGLRDRLLALKPGEVYRVDAGKYGWVAARRSDYGDAGDIYQFGGGAYGKKTTFPRNQGLFSLDSIIKKFSWHLTGWQNRAQNVMGSGMLRDMERDPAQVDRERVELVLVVNLCKKLAPAPKAYTTKATWKLPVDFHHWKYTPDADATKKWNELGPTKPYVSIELWFAQHQGRSGQYSETNNTIQVDVQSRGVGIVDNQAAFQEVLGRITKTSWHELLHFGQYAARRLLGLPEHAGLPSKSIRKPEYDAHGFRKDLSATARRFLSQQDHAQRDIEFYSDLSNACFALVRELRRIPEPRRDAFFRSFVGETADPANNPFFLDWKTGNPGKWRKAVKELYKEMTR